MLRKKLAKKEGKAPENAQQQEKQNEEQNLDQPVKKVSKKQLELEALQAKVNEIMDLLGKQFSQEQMEKGLQQNQMDVKKTIEFLIKNQQEEKNLKNSLLFSKAKKNLVSEENFKILNNENSFFLQNIIGQNKNKDQTNLINIERELKLTVPKEFIDLMKENFSKPSPDQKVEKKMNQAYQDSLNIL